MAVHLVNVVGWISLFASIGQGFAGRSAETPQIIVGIFAVTLLNVTINLGRWTGLNSSQGQK